MFWFMFVDDTFIIQQQAHKQLFLDHIHSIDPAIKFIVESNQENGAIPIPDTLDKPKADNSLSISVYQKPTHTDKFLQWDSHHNLSAKYSDTGTPTHRAKTVCTTTQLLNEELQHLREALQGESTQGGPLVKYKINLQTTTKRDMVTITPKLTTTPHKQTTTQATAVRVDPPGEDPM